MSAKNPRGTLPAFTPVPRLKERSNGWSPEVQQAFIEALAETGSVKSACLAVDRGDRGAYFLRSHAEAGEFRKAWDAALAIGIRRIEDVAMDRALNGVEVPIYHSGELVGTRRVYNDYLLMFLLRNRAPKRFAADSARAMSAVDKHYVARLQKQWRKDWDREHAIDQNAASRAREKALCELFDDHHRQWFLRLGPKARAAYREFRLIARAERTTGLPETNKEERDWLTGAEEEYCNQYAFNKDHHSRLQRLAETFLHEADGVEEDGGEVVGPALPGPEGEVG